MLIYTVTYPVQNEKFSEFYILGQDGKAADYPSAFTLQNGNVVSVKYGDAELIRIEDFGQITMGIVDQEQQQTRYMVKLQIDDQPANILFQGQTLEQLDGISLTQGQKWENEIGFAPSHTGDNQKVEFFLYKDGATEAEDTVHLWINVKSQ